MKTKNLKFHPHTSSKSPVSGETVVVYRTTSPENARSHIHFPIKAKHVIWSNVPHLGRILEYAIV